MASQTRERTGDRQRLTAQAATWVTCVVATLTFVLAAVLAPDLWTALFRAAVVAVATRLVAGLLAAPVIDAVLDALVTDRTAHDDSPTANPGGRS